jgi:hypothetical protein
LIVGIGVDIGIVLVYKGRGITVERLEVVGFIDETKLEPIVCYKRSGAAYMERHKARL